ncbi:hypothetical protein [Bradyrhizobium zhanjiangense]|uniref:hypothetical protein n=1 Tax=Bradyrhizobium zhanjiangense TaxID=1325107 RepID=UPI00100891E8|nr:hypothetical protein [Bradyrhizobium zhanjiangense]
MLQRHGNSMTPGGLSSKTPESPEGAGKFGLGIDSAVLATAGSRLANLSGVAMGLYSGSTDARLADNQMVVHVAAFRL